MLHFSLFSSLVGGLFTALLGFFIPAVMYIKLFYEDMSLFSWIWNVFVVVFALFCMVAGTYWSLLTLSQEKII